MKLNNFLVAGAVVIAAIGSPAIAQNQTAAGQAGQGRPLIIEEIVVTARRVSENIQDVPVSVTAIQGERLAQFGVSGPIDLRTVVAGLNVTAAAGRDATPLYALRGLRAADQVFTQDPPVTAYLDEVLVSPIFGSNLGLFDLENVQVLKGPQGTLFGRNTSGGAILYSTAKPTEEFEGKLTLGAGNYSSKKVNGFINMPVNDAVRLRAAIDYKDRDGWGELTEGPQAGKDSYQFENTGARVSAAIDPTDWMQTLTSVTYSKAKSEAGPAYKILDTPQAFLNFIFPTLGESLAKQRAEDEYDFASAELNGSEAEVWSVSNTITINLSDNLTLKNILGYRKLDVWDSQDYDGTILPILAASNAARADTYSEELQLQGTTFDDRLNFIFGLYYFDEQGTEGTGLPYMKASNQLVGTVAFGGTKRLQFTRITNQSFSGFGQIGYDLTDELTFNAGLRYTVDRRRANSTVGTVEVNPATGGPIPTSCAYTDDEGNFLPATYADCRLNPRASFTEPSWLIGLDWKPDPLTLIYIASRHSYRSGGFQSRPFDNTTAQLTFAPEKVTDVELGVKRDWELSDNVGLRTNLAAYYEWYKDIQRTSTTLTPVGVGNVVENAAKATIQGFEVETELRIGSLARLAVNWAYVKPEYDDYIARSTVAGVPNTPVDRSDHDFQNIPSHQVNANLILTPAVGDLGELTLIANLYYASKQPFSEDYNSAEHLQELLGPNGVVPNDLFVAQKAYTLVNARAQLDDIAGSGFSVAVWAQNLTDKQYFDSGVLFQNSIGFGMGVLGAPRTYGVDVTYNF